MSFFGGSDGEEFAYSVGDLGSVLGLGRSPAEGNGNALQYSCLENPWSEEPGRLQSMRSQRVKHDWATNSSLRLGGSSFTTVMEMGVWMSQEATIQPCSVTNVTGIKQKHYDITTSPCSLCSPHDSPVNLREGVLRQGIWLFRKPAD